MKRSSQVFIIYILPVTGAMEIFLLYLFTCANVFDSSIHILCINKHVEEYFENTVLSVMVE